MNFRVRVPADCKHSDLFFSRFCSRLAVKQAEEEAEQLCGVQHAAVAQQDQRLHQLHPDRGVLSVHT